MSAFLINRLKILIPEGGVKRTAHEADIGEDTLHKWFRGGADPRLSRFESVLAVHGYRLRIVKMEKK